MKNKYTPIHILMLVFLLVMLIINICFMASHADGYFPGIDVLQRIYGLSIAMLVICILLFFLKYFSFIIAFTIYAALVIICQFVVLRMYFFSYDPAVGLGLISILFVIYLFTSERSHTVFWLN